MSRRTIGEEMTKNLVTISNTEKIAEAYRLMYANKIRHLPVVDRDGDVCGILSDRDVQRAMESQVSDSFGFKMESVKFKDEAKVMDYMAWPVRTFAADTDIKMVLQSMLDNKVSAFLITEKTEVVGIVTTDDFLHLLKNLLDDDDEDNTLVLGEVFTSPLFGRVAKMVGDAGI